MIIKYHKNKWEAEGFRVNIQATEEMGGHGDATWCILKPGVIVTLFDLQNYSEKFPGWDICYLEDKYWDQLSPFRTMKKKVGGKWWIKGQEHNDQLIDYVETWLGDWVGYCEETVFEVNCLVIDESNVLVIAQDDDVCKQLEQVGITPHVVDFKTRGFWDGGLHCLTVDIRRTGKCEDYWPDRGLPAIDYDTEYV